MVWELIKVSKNLFESCWKNNRLIVTKLTAFDNPPKTIGRVFD